MMKKWGYPLSAVVLGSSLMLSACGSAETPKEEKNLRQLNLLHLLLLKRQQLLPLLI